MAKITHVTILKADLPPMVARSDAVQSLSCQETPMVRIRDADGAEGIGYAYTLGTGGNAVMKLLEDHLAPRLLGRDADEIERLWRDLFYHVHATTVGVLTSIALAAIDVALWDLRAKRASLPLHRLAGGAKDSLPIYPTEGDWTQDVGALVEEALATREKGCYGIKIKVGRPRLSDDIARLEAVRKAVGDEWDIMTDANQGLSVDEAIRRARRYEDYDIGWFEEPLHADDIEAHRRLCASTSIPIAVGESLYSLSQFKEYLQRNACSIVQVDPARIGGVTPWLKVAHLAEAFNLPVCPHFLSEINLPLMCAVPNSRCLEYIPQLEMIMEQPIHIEGGRAFPSETPGTGIAWDWEAVRRFTVFEQTLKA